MSGLFLCVVIWNRRGEKAAVDQKSAVKPVGDLLFLFPVEFRDIVLEPEDAGAYGKRDADGGNNRFAPIEGLDLDLHITQILFCAAHDDVAVPPVPEVHDPKRVDLGKHLWVNVLGMPGDDVMDGTKFSSLHRTFAEDPR